MKTDNSSFERVDEFKYFGTALTNQNSIQEEIKSRLKLGNACYHSVQNILSSSLLSKNLKIKIRGPSQKKCTERNTYRTEHQMCGKNVIVLQCSPPSAECLHPNVLEGP